MTDLTQLSAVELAAAIGGRRVSCTEVMTAHLDRIEALNPAANAIVALQDRGDLLAQAGAKDAEIARGGAAGRLHGFPHAVKDLTPVRGIVSTQGSPIFRDTVPAADGLAAERLRRAGAIFIGKTNTPEFGLGSHTYNPVYGATSNAFDRQRSAGGSSGGAAVALALGLVPLADGSDYGGSLRNPAGWNNVFGFRPSIGRVPADALDAWLPSMGVTGPMARSVDDLALLLSVQAGHDARAPMSLPGDGSGFAVDLRRDLAGLRIGWLGDFGGAAPCEDGVLEVCETALRAFEALGCHVEPARPNASSEDAWRAFLTLRSWQAGARLEPLYRAHRPLMKPEAVYEVESGLRLSAFEVAAASVARTRWSAAAHRLFDAFDVLIAPTAQVFPFDIEMTWPSAIGGHAMSTYHEWMKANCLVTLSGCPSLAAPAGFAPTGLPMGIQIIAPVWEELRCLQVAKAYEDASQGLRAARAVAYP